MATTSTILGIKYINFHVENIAKNVIYFLIDHQEMLNHKKICLFTETGKHTKSFLDEKCNKGYILLGFAIYNDSALKNKHPLLSPHDMCMLKKICINKTTSKVSHHFNTEGIIFSFGYGPK